MNDKQLRKQFKNFGYKGRSITEIWYANHPQIINKFDSLVPTLGQKIDKQIRWETDDGKKVLGEVRTFIKNKLQETSSKFSENYKQGITNIESTIIDFNELKINGQTINQYLYSKIKHNYTTSGWNDLAGIPLSGIRIDNAIIKNVNLSHANFDNSTLQNIEFDNCNLHDCSFNNCHITSIRGKVKGCFSDSSWHGSLVNNIEISSENFGLNPSFKRINYFQLLKVSLLGKTDTNIKYTDFSACYIKEDNIHYEFKEYIDYINWYQSTIYKYCKIFNTKNFFAKNYLRIQNFINAFTTKNWSSPSITLSTGGLIIFLFSMLYFFVFNEYFCGLDVYSKALNFSIYIFTSLGLSDLKPNPDKGNIGFYIVSVECILGYIWLALTMMVFSKKIFK